MLAAVAPTVPHDTGRFGLVALPGSVFAPTTATSGLRHGSDGGGGGADALITRLPLGTSAAPKPPMTT